MRVRLDSAWLHALALFVIGAAYLGKYGANANTFTFRQDSVTYASTGNTFAGTTRSDTASQSTIVGTVFMLLGLSFVVFKFVDKWYQHEIMLPVYSATCRYVLYATMIPMLALANGASSLGTGIFMTTALMGTVVSSFLLDLIVTALYSEHGQLKGEKKDREEIRAKISVGMELTAEEKMLHESPVWTRIVHLQAMALDHGYHSAPLGLAVSSAYAAIVYLMVAFGSPFNSSTSVPTNVTAALSVVAVDIIMNVAFAVVSPYVIKHLNESKPGEANEYNEPVTHGCCRGSITPDGLHSAWTVAAFSAVAFLLAGGPGFT